MGGKATKKSKIKVINVLKDGRELESLEGIEAPEVLYDILFKDYKARGIKLIVVNNS